jgi:hypothetical protein
MVTVTKKWRRWCGPRSELVRATELAADVLRAWSGVDSAIAVGFTERGGISEGGPGVEQITRLHPAELASLASLSLTIRPDRDLWWKQREAARERGEEAPASLPEAQVSVRLTEYGTTLTVEGEDRTSVVGLTQQLTQILGRSASTRFNREWVWGLASPLILAGAFAALVVVRWLDLAKRDDHWQAAEIVALTVGGILGLALAAAFWWIFPRVEIFDEGGAGRARRFRVWIVGIAGALIVGVLGSFIYDQVT